MNLSKIAGRREKESAFGEENEEELKLGRWYQKKTVIDIPVEPRASQTLKTTPAMSQLQLLHLQKPILLNLFLSPLTADSDLSCL